MSGEKRYLGITIGPIGEAMAMAMNPAGLWAASYLFSSISRRLYAALQERYGTGEGREQETAAGGSRVTILAPCFSFSPLERETERLVRELMGRGVGFYPDHILLEIEPGRHEEVESTAVAQAAGSMRCIPGTPRSTPGTPGTGAGRKREEVSDVFSEVAALAQKVRAEAAGEIARALILRGKDQGSEAPKVVVSEADREKVIAQLCRTLRIHVLECSEEELLRGQKSGDGRGESADGGDEGRETRLSRIVGALSQRLDAAELWGGYHPAESVNYLSLFLGDRYAVRKSSWVRKLGRNWQLRGGQGSSGIRTLIDLAAAGEPESELSRQRKVRHYYALVSSDGDHMGRIARGLGNVEQQHLFSLSCVRYAARAARRVMDYGGMVVYAGGDDLQFIAPVLSAGTAQGTDQQGAGGAREPETIFSLICGIEQDFRETFSALLGELREMWGSELSLPTISFGVAITFEKAPLYETLSLSAQLLREAKQTRDAAVFALQKHAGKSARIAARRLSTWSEGQAEGPAVQRPDYFLTPLRELIGMACAQDESSEGADEPAEDAGTGVMLHSILSHLYTNEALFLQAFAAPGRPVKGESPEAVQAREKERVRRQRERIARFFDNVFDNPEQSSRSRFVGLVAEMAMDLDANTLVGLSAAERERVTQRNWARAQLDQLVSLIRFVNLFSEKAGPEAGEGESDEREQGPAAPVPQSRPAAAAVEAAGAAGEQSAGSERPAVPAVSREPEGERRAAESNTAQSVPSAQRGVAPDRPAESRVAPERAAQSGSASGGAAWNEAAPGGPAQSRVVPGRPAEGKAASGGEEYFEVRLTPLGAYFLGMDRTFAYGEGELQREGGDSYYVSSERIPSQQTLFGVLRYLGIREKRADFRLTKEDQENIGPASFRYQPQGRAQGRPGALRGQGGAGDPEQDFGRILEISPLYLLGPQGDILVRTPLDHKEGERFYTPFCEEREIWGTPKGRGLMLVPADYDAKSALTRSFVRVGPGRRPGAGGELLPLREVVPEDTLFSEEVRTQIQKEKNEQAYFRVRYVRLARGYSFAFRVRARAGFLEQLQGADGESLLSSTVRMGRSGLFGVEVERYPQGDPDRARAWSTLGTELGRLFSAEEGEAGISGDQRLPVSGAPLHRRVLYLASDALLWRRGRGQAAGEPEGSEEKESAGRGILEAYTSFGITEERTVRQVVTRYTREGEAAVSQKRRYQKSQELYRLLRAGSIFRIDPKAPGSDDEGERNSEEALRALFADAHLQTIGMNRVFITGGERG